MQKPPGVFRLVVMRGSPVGLLEQAVAAPLEVEEGVRVLAEVPAAVIVLQVPWGKVAMARQVTELEVEAVTMVGEEHLVQVEEEALAMSRLVALALLFLLVQGQVMGRPHWCFLLLRQRFSHHFNQAVNPPGIPPDNLQFNLHGNPKVDQPINQVGGLLCSLLQVQRISLVQNRRFNQQDVQAHNQAQCRLHNPQYSLHVNQHQYQAFNQLVTPLVSQPINLHCNQLDSLPINQVCIPPINPRHILQSSLVVFQRVSQPINLHCNQLDSLPINQVCIPPINQPINLLIYSYLRLVCCLVVNLLVIALNLLASLRLIPVSVLMINHLYCPRFILLHLLPVIRRL